MSPDSEAGAGKWRTVRTFGSLMTLGGLILSVLPLVITGPGAGVIDPFIVIGPFMLIVGIVSYAFALVGAWRINRRH